MTRHRDDPIIAIATPAGRGGIGVVRLSFGCWLAESVAAFVARLCAKPDGFHLVPRHATLVGIAAADGATIDRGIALLFAAPASYTGDDVLELQVHGGPVVLRMIVARCLAVADEIVEKSTIARKALVRKTSRSSRRSPGRPATEWIGGWTCSPKGCDSRSTLDVAAERPRPTTCQEIFGKFCIGNQRSPHALRVTFPERLATIQRSMYRCFMEETNVVTALAALAHAQRLRVFRALVVAGASGLTPSVMAEGLGVARNALSFHLKELSHASLITAEQRGRHLIYRAAYDQMDGLLAYLTENCCAGETCAVQAESAACA